MRRLFLVSLLLCSLLLLACGGNQTSSPSSSSQNDSDSAQEPSNDQTETNKTEENFPITIAYSVVSPSTIPLFITHYAGLFEQHGLDVNLLYAQGGAATTAAVLSGDAPIAYTGSEIVNTNGDIKTVALSIPTLLYDLVAKSEIQGPEDLKNGKKVGIASFGGTSDISIRYLAKEFNLKVGEDLVLLKTGGESDRALTLSEGHVDATVITPPYQDFGPDYHVIYNYRTVDQPILSNGLVASAKFIESNRDVVKRAVAAMIDGIQYLKTNDTGSKEIIMEQLKLDDADAQIALDAIREAVPDIPLPTVEAVEQSIELTEIAKGESIETDPAAIIDPSFVEELTN